MKLKRDQLLIIVLVAGFLFGVLYVSKMEIKGKIFDPTVIDILQEYKLDNKKYLICIVRERIGIFLFLLFLSNVRWKQMYGAIVTFAIGIIGGAVIAMAMTQAGLRGGIACFLCLMPHSLFYSLAYWILINYWVKNGRWNGSKTCGIIIFMLLGISSEIYINPSLVKLFV